MFFPVSLAGTRPPLPAPPPSSLLCDISGHPRPQRSLREQARPGQTCPRVEETAAATQLRKAAGEWAGPGRRERTRGRGGPRGTSSQGTASDLHPESWMEWWAAWASCPAESSIFHSSVLSCRRHNRPDRRTNRCGWPLVTERETEVAEEIRRGRSSPGWVPSSQRQNLVSTPRGWAARGRVFR